LPKRNAKDLVDVPKKARSEMQIVLVDHIDQVLDIALLSSKPEITHHKRSERKSKVKLTGMGLSLGLRPVLDSIVFISKLQRKLPAKKWGEERKNYPLEWRKVMSHLVLKLSTGSI
jgi:hypothetical protein